jgi:2-oxoglutarate dehydrogenase complex dehydrogenase (E1) component-like enzyme
METNLAVHVVVEHGSHAHGGLQHSVRLFPVSEERHKNTHSRHTHTHTHTHAQSTSEREGECGPEVDATRALVVKGQIDIEANDGVGVGGAVLEEVVVGVVDLQ